MWAALLFPARLDAADVIESGQDEAADRIHSSSLRGEPTAAITFPQTNRRVSNIVPNNIGLVKTMQYGDLERRRWAITDTNAINFKRQSSLAEPMTFRQTMTEKSYGNLRPLFDTKIHFIIILLWNILINVLHGFVCQSWLYQMSSDASFCWAALRLSSHSNRNIFYLNFYL